MERIPRRAEARHRRLQLQADLHARHPVGGDFARRPVDLDQFNDRVIEITHAGKIVFQQGTINAPGMGFNQLNGPYDAKVIGDFTGLTPPFGENSQ